MSTDIELDHPPVGWVVDSFSGEVGPLTLWRGDPLVRWATDALLDAGVLIVDERIDWSQLGALDAPVVVADTACPGVPASFIAACVQRAVAEGRPVVGVRSVTDTLKATSVDGWGATINRDEVVQICAPVVLPSGAWGERATPPTDVVAWVRELPEVVLVEAPASAARIADPAALVLLEASDAHSA